tara:strand:+ start:280144 stop:281322 length:1179 start_codon:yes stop_codon:yes gene_type:complete
MKRKDFIKTSLLTLALLSFSPQKILSKSNERASNLAIDYSTMFSIAKFAINAGGLFKGASSFNISDYQVKMLENISNQLKTLQETLKLIVLNINNIFVKIDEIPDRVVLELAQIQSQGNFRAFDELMRTLFKLDNNKIKFVADNEVEIRALIASIRKDRNILMEFNNYSNISIVASMVYMEYNLMRMINENEERLLASMESYKLYFEKMLYGKPQNDINFINLEELIKDIRVKTLENLTEINEPIHFYVKKKKLAHGHTWTFNDRIYYLKKEQIENSNVNILIKLGLIEKHETLLVLNYVKSKKKAGLISLISKREGLLAYGDSIAQPGGSGVKIFNGVTLGEVPLIEDKEEELENRKVKLESEYNINRMKLYSMASSFYAGNMALNFCQQF